jgi:hypothetical protein
MSDQTPQCVPLCRASNAYGRFVKWWHHEALCPAREGDRRAVMLSLAEQGLWIVPEEVTDDE